MIGVSRVRGVAAHQPGDFEAVHTRHLHVQQHQPYILFEQTAQGLFAGTGTAQQPLSIFE